MPSSDIAEQSEPPWVAAGLVSSFANLDSDEAAPLSQARACRSGNAPGCRAFRVPDDSDDGGDGGSGIKAPEVQIGERDSMPRCALRDLRNQVLVFQYRGKFHAIDHVSLRLSLSLLSSRLGEAVAHGPQIGNEASN